MLGQRAGLARGQGWLAGWPEGRAKRPRERAGHSPSIYGKGRIGKKGREGQDRPQDRAKAKAGTNAL